MPNLTRLKDAGIREIEWAQQLVNEGKLPCTFQEVMDHGVYDSHLDLVVMTIKAVVYKFKVNRG